MSGASVFGSQGRLSKTAVVGQSAVSGLLFPVANDVGADEHPTSEDSYLHSEGVLRIREARTAYKYLSKQQGQVNMTKFWSHPKYK